jgi:hypothetical protein
MHQNTIASPVCIFECGGQVYIIRPTDNHQHTENSGRGY